MTAGETREQLDCAVLALQEWRNAYRLFDHFVRRLNESAVKRDLSGLAGSVVDIHFGQMSDLPPKRSDDSVIEPLLKALDGARVDYEAAVAHGQHVAEHGMNVGDQFPPGIIATGQTPDGSAGFTANPHLDPAGPGVPPDMPLQVCLQKNEHLTPTSAIAIVQKRVSDHDKPTIDHLLITAGGPDVDGLRYPGEEMVARFLVGLPEVALHATYLKRATLHMWGSTEIVDIPIRRT